MDIVFYVIIFIVGTLLGSFYATTIKRMSKEKKVFSIHSYCSNCGKKIGVFQKIPILSYIFLKGRCKQCNEKIEPIYIILETVTGIIFLVAAYALKLRITEINITNIISFIFIVLYFSYIIIAIGLDIKCKKMSPSLLAYGVIISIVYIVYLLIEKSTTIYINTIYLIIMILLLLLNILNAKKRAQGSYVIDLLTMLFIMLIFTEESICILTIIGTLVAIALYILMNKLKSKGKRKNTDFNSNIRVASIMGILNIFILLALMNVQI